MSKQKVRKPVSVPSEKASIEKRKPLRNKQMAAVPAPRAQANIVAPEVTPPLKRPKVARIDKSLDVCLRELGRVYKQMRRGQIRAEVGTRLVKAIQAAAQILAHRESNEDFRKAMVEWQAARRQAGMPVIASLPAMAGPGEQAD
jgi:hypothetical protein